MKMEEEEEEKERIQLCFQCLHHRIKSDFSDQLIFSYGFSHSPLPFASSAVVQMSNSNGEPSSASQFILVYVPSHQDDCLTKYVDEYALEINGSGDDDDQTTSRNLLSHKTQNLSNWGGKFSVDGVGYGVLMCNHSRRFSCLRTITALFPVSHVGVCSYSAFEEFASDFFVWVS